MDEDIPWKKCCRCKEVLGLRKFNTTITKICIDCTAVCKPYVTGNKLDIYRYRAEKNSLPFNLTMEDIIVPESCPISGIKFDDSSFDNRPELDRVVPKLGYVKGNVYYINGRLNRLKNDATLYELELLVKYMKDKLGQSDIVPTVL